MSVARIKQISIGPMMNCAYLIGDDDSGLCAVVDSSWDASAIMEEAKSAGWKIDKILLTHTHFDHTNATEELVKSTGALVYVNKAEASEIPKSIKTINADEGDIIEVGKLKIKCLHTPGHTPGSLCYLSDDALFTGDTLFVDGCGRVDLPGSNPKQMLQSLRRLSTLSPEITIYPGHDYGPSKTSTIGAQKKRNPYMNADSEGTLL